MSFLTDLFKGNFGNLGKDITHDPLGSSLAFGLPLAIAAPFLLPELGSALGIGAGAAEAGAAGAGAEAAGAGLAGTEALAGGLTPGAAALGGDATSALALAAPETAAAANPLATVAAPAATAAGSDLLSLGGAGATAAGDTLTLGGAGADAASAAGGGIGSSILDFAGANKGLLASLGLGLGGIALAPKLSGLINKVPQQQQLQTLQGQEAALAQSQAATGNTLTQPLITGQLPSGAEQTVQNAINDAINTTKARYANLGLSGSTMEADAISQIQNKATESRFAIAQQMAQTGAQATSQAANAMGLQDQVFAQLMNAQVAQDTALQQAIARMAAGAALGSGLNTAQKQGAAAGSIIS